MKSNATKPNEADNSPASEKEQPRQKGPFTASASKFNISAPPFYLKHEIRENQLKKTVENESGQSEPTVHVGLTQVPVNGRIWPQIAANLDPNPYFDNMALKRGDEWNREHFYNNMDPYSMMQSMSSEPEYPVYPNYPSQPAMKKFGPVVKSDGTIELELKDDVKVRFTLDKAVIVHNQVNNIKIALSSNMNSSALQHPNGKVYQQSERVDIVAYDGMKRNNFVRYARMYPKGVSLTSDGCALIYLVDDAGTRTTSDAINIDLYSDNCEKVFMSSTNVNSNVYSPEALNIVDSYQYWHNDDGSESFELNGFRISQAADGLVKLTRTNTQCIIRTSPKNGSATLTTPFIHCTASLGSTSHLFVRRGERRMHFDGANFVVRNAGHSAGFEERNLLRVY